MKLTKEQFDALTPYKSHFETIIRSDYCRYPGTAALDLINDIYVQVTGVQIRINKCCNACVVNLMRDMGHIYMADLAEKTKVDVAKTETATPGKVEVKTKRKTTRKPKTQE